MAGGLVMIVEDDRDTRDSLGEVLSDEGFAVVLAKSGRDALTQLARGVRPSIRLVDVSMPDMDGVELCEHWMKEPELRVVPLFFCSGLADMSRLHGRCVPTGVFGKPLDVAQLLSTMKQYVP